jgi:hypothetical protein
MLNPTTYFRTIREKIYKKFQTYPSSGGYIGAPRGLNTLGSSCAHGLAAVPLQHYHVNFFYCLYSEPA